MKINIAICDDEKVEIEYLSLYVKKWSELKNINVNISPFYSAESFLFNYCENKSYDVLLLDIQMKELNGIELAKKIRKENKVVQIIFITGLPDFIAEGYEVSALHYLMKPVREEKLFETLDKACENLKQKEKFLLLTIIGETHRIPLSEIQYIEAQGHYILIKTKTNEYKTKMNLSEMQNSLDKSFFRCQRSFIVNLVYVKIITRTSIVLDNMVEIPLSRNLYEAANRAVIEYFP